VTIPLSPFIGEVGGDVLFISHDGVDIHNNTIRGYKWTPVGFYLQRCNKGYKWTPNIILLTPRLCNWTLNTTMRVPNI
jgi:hypothetical protein